MRILLIQADEAEASRIHAGLQTERFTVDVAASGEIALQRARQGGCALLILDLTLRGEDGLSLCRALRAQQKTVPILLLAGRDEEVEGLRGLESGADACLSKPFDFKELLAMVRVLLRREKLRQSHVIRIADLEIDRSALQVRRAGRDITLTPHEFSLLEALATHEGQTLTREIILHRVWGGAHRYPNTVSFHIASLRKKIVSGTR